MRKLIITILTIFLIGCLAGISNAKHFYYDVNGTEIKPYNQEHLNYLYDMGKIAKIVNSDNGHISFLKNTKVVKTIFPSGQIQIHNKENHNIIISSDGHISFLKNNKIVKEIFPDGQIQIYNKENHDITIFPDGSMKIYDDKGKLTGLVSSNGTMQVYEQGENK